MRIVGTGLRSFFALAVVVLGTASVAEPARPRVITRALGTLGASNSSYDGAVTPNGRFVVYWSYATNLVPRDRNGTADVFLRDRRRGTTRRLSVDPAGNDGDGDSYTGGISADGRFILFASYAANLVLGDTNLASDIFVHDRKIRQTKRISIAANGAEANSHSFLVIGACISANGRYVVFRSGATNLVPGADNGREHVYVADLEVGSLSLVSVGIGGSQGNDGSYDPSISSSGRFVAYSSDASNLIPSDTNDARDVFAYDRETGSTRRASVASDGTAGNAASSFPVVSDNGLVAFQATANNLVSADTNGSPDIFLHDFVTGETRRISVAADGSQVSGESHYPAISSDGKTVVFTIAADGAVLEDANGYEDVFAYDVPTGTLRLLSANAKGSPGNGDSITTSHSLSFDGMWCAFTSAATNLVRHDRNGDIPDVFLVRLR